MTARAEAPVGLIPAAGTASRLGTIPCSKEVYPLGFRRAEPEGRLRPRAAAEHLLDAIRVAGARRAFVVLRTGKWDIPAFLEGGERVGLDLAYLVTGSTPGVPYTLARAIPFLEESRVLFGFPDILFEPVDALQRMLARQRQGGADVVLGLFQASRPSKMDMVRRGRGGRIESILIKPERTELRYTWILAVWTARFTGFLSRWCGDVHRRFARGGDAAAGAKAREPYLGHVLQDALDAGLAVDSVRFDRGRYVDIGTPRELATTVRRLAVEPRSPAAGRARTEGPGSGENVPREKGD